MEKSFFQGERLSRKKAKKIYVLATVTSGLCLLAKLILLIGSIFVFWHIVWQLPDATLGVIKKYFNYCAENSLTVSAAQLAELEKIQNFMEQLSARKIGAFSFPITQILNFSMLQGTTADKVAWGLYVGKLLTFVIFLFKRSLFPRWIRELVYVFRDGFRLPDKAYGENYDRNMKRFKEIVRFKAYCEKMLKWINPKLKSDKARLQSHYHDFKHYIKVNKRKFKRERKLLKRNPQTSSGLSDIFYYRCVQTRNILWGKDVDVHINFYEDKLSTEERLKGEAERFNNFKRYCDPAKLNKYNRKFESHKENKRLKRNSKKFLYQNYKYSILKSYNNTFRQVLATVLFIAVIFVLYFGVLNGVATLELSVFKWFLLDLQGIWWFVLAIVGVLFYFICGILAGKVLDIERVERDQYYRNLQIVGKDTKNVYLREAGRIRKNTTIKRSSLRRIPREYRITVFVFRNICQIVFSIILYLLFLATLKHEALNVISNYHITKSLNEPTWMVVAKLVVFIVFGGMLFAVFKYSFSSNEFRVSTMREDRRFKAKWLYRVPMLLMAVLSVALLVFSIITGATLIRYVTLGGMTLLGLIAFTADLLLMPRDPDEDIGVDFFHDDGYSRDPDDGPYIP